MSSKGGRIGLERPTRKARFALASIGAGVMGSNHARVLAGLPDTTLVGIVDPMPAQRARAGEMAGLSCFRNP